MSSRKNANLATGSRSALPVRESRQNLYLASTPGKSRLPVLEVVQRGDGTAPGEVAEQVLTAGAGGDGGRDDAADPAGGRGDRREPFGE